MATRACACLRGPRRIQRMVSILLRTHCSFQTPITCSVSVPSQQPTCLSFTHTEEISRHVRKEGEWDRDIEGMRPSCWGVWFKSV
eukprot:508451-Rhodomonas_salina.5